MARQEILLETGTNEVEVAEFIIGNQSFGVNVAKIREFVPYAQVEVTKIPEKHQSMLGVFLLRNKTIPLIDLKEHLDIIKDENTPPRQVVVITDFNGMINGFIIDSINRIYRFSWKDIQPMDSFLENCAKSITGSINVDNKEILVLDLERIIDEVFPESAMSASEEDFVDKPQEELREHAKLIIAEDSATIRSLMLKILSAVGYKNVTAYENGKDAFDAFVKLKKRSETEGKDIKEYVDLAIFDIEMPQMDGLTLCKSVKYDMGLKQVPVIMFSSLINEQMALKCTQVGADKFITKPQIHKLVRLADEFCIAKSN